MASLISALSRGISKRALAMSMSRSHFESRSYSGAVHALHALRPTGRNPSVSCGLQLALPLRAADEGSTPRYFCTGESFDVDKHMRLLAGKFAETRLELEDCADSVGTTYFSDDLNICIECVEYVCGNFCRYLVSHQIHRCIRELRRCTEIALLRELNVYSDVLNTYEEIMQHHTANDDTDSAKRLRESWALKLEQLKGELAQLLESNDH
eukprot:m.940479 g.940479  ORF g.940479 m.940479 type:complete len:210 (+) comp23828_c0_seq8:125-754(+)